MRGALLVVLALCSLSLQAQPDKLSAYESGAVSGAAHMAYYYGLLSLAETAPGEYHTALEPLLCWPFPVDWADFYGRIEDNVRSQLAQLTRKQRNALGENIKYRAQQALFEEYGCP